MFCNTGSTFAILRNAGKPAIVTYEREFPRNCNINMNEITNVRICRTNPSALASSPSGFGAFLSFDTQPPILGAITKTWMRQPERGAVTQLICMCVYVYIKLRTYYVRNECTRQVVSCSVVVGELAIILSNYTVSTTPLPTTRPATHTGLHPTSQFNK